MANVGTINILPYMDGKWWLSFVPTSVASLIYRCMLISKQAKYIQIQVFFLPAKTRADCLLVSYHGIAVAVSQACPVLERPKAT